MCNRLVFNRLDIWISQSAIYDPLINKRNGTILVKNLFHTQFINLPRDRMSYFQRKNMGLGLDNQTDSCWFLTSRLTDTETNFKKRQCSQN